MSRFAKFFLKLLLWGLACILAVALVLATVCVALHATADLDEPEFSPTEGNAEIVSRQPPQMEGQCIAYQCGRALGDEGFRFRI